MTIYSDTLDGSDITCSPTWPFCRPWGRHASSSTNIATSRLGLAHWYTNTCWHQYFPHIGRVYPNLEHPSVLLFSLLCHLLIGLLLKLYQISEFSVARSKIEIPRDVRNRIPKTRLSSQQWSISKSKIGQNHVSRGVSFLCQHSTSITNTKRRRSDPVLWQKPLYQQKCQRGKVTTQTTPQKSSIKQQLRTDLGRSVGVTTATQLVWLTGLRAHLPTPRNSRVIKRTHI